MRERMPKVAGFIDDLRGAFGKADVDGVIRRGLRPDCEPVQRVFASEDGSVVGQRVVSSVEVSVADMVLRQPIDDATPSVKKGRR